MKYELGVWLKKRRRALDLTQEDLAQRAYCSVHTIRKIETGDLKPSEELALELARALALPVQTRASFVNFARTPEATAPENAFAQNESASLGAETAELASASPTATPPSENFRLPAPLTLTIGREHDTGVIARVLRLPTARLVTLTGPPGTGKTRLALQVAEEVQSQFQHGAVFVPLAPVGQPALVEIAIAQALNVRNSAQAPIGIALREFLRDKQLLLVLDNFEHLLDAALIVAELLSHAPRLKILTTSRERLRVYGERELPVAPLTIPPLSPLPPLQALEKYSAVQLFIERAQALKPDFELTGENAETIARLSVGLEGIPLAIEMAAARLKWEPPQELLSQLTRRLETFSGRARNLDARHRTLRGALDWSYELLEDNEKRVLRHLGVFRGGLTVAAANAVCDFETNMLLERLVEKSLVKFDSQHGRYSLLEMIRDYALEKSSAAGEQESARLRHATFFAQRLETLAPNYMRADWIQVRAQIDREQDNLRGALDWAIADGRGELVLRLVAALVPYWEGTNSLGEGITWFERVTNLDAADMQNSMWRAQVRDGYARFLRLNGHYRRARELFEQAIADWQRVGDAGKPSLALTLSEFSLLNVSQGDPKAAHSAARSGLALYQELGDTAGQSVAWRRLAESAMVSRDYPYVAECVARALELGDTLRSDYERLLILRIRGDMHRALGDFKNAERDYLEALALNATMQDTYIQVRLERSLGVTATERGAFAEASTRLSNAARLADQLGHRSAFTQVLVNTAWFAVRQNKLEPAARLLGAVDTLQAESGAHLYPPEVLEYESTIALIRATVTKETYLQWLAQGRALPPGQVLTLLDQMWV